jgi:hypothetical protein
VVAVGGEVGDEVVGGRELLLPLLGLPWGGGHWCGPAAHKGARGGSPSAGHQLTGTSAWYASPFLKSCRKIHCVHLGQRG